MKRFWTVFGLLTLAAMIAVIGGCSRDNVAGPTGSFADNTGWVIPSLVASPGDSVQFTARVRTMDQNRLMLTFMGLSDTVIATHNCEIVRLNNTGETPIPFSDIHNGDSLKINGVKQQNQYILAYKIQNCTGDCYKYDLAFRDTIISIDYDAMTFTVANRTEVITVDENTEIWGNIVHQYGYDNRVNGDTPPSGGAGKLIYQYQFMSSSRDTTLTFADLTIGDVVEVKADIVDESTLLAVKIKVANCLDQEPQCTQFTAPLASVDVDGKIVTWEGNSWIGLVCKGSQLLAADGTELTLADFAVGENVAVKGLPLTGDTLKVCKMQKVD
ncbi:exported hypothetical protein [Candidatus Zixiibacteriota bacterium]|nr:exported hypothetical protein [candidate division Zixibacteria bacterium]